MSKIGIEYLVMGELGTSTSGSAATYTNARTMGTTVNISGSPNTNDAKDYGDDNAVETDNSVTGGTLSIEKNELALDEYAFLLGHEYDAEDGVISNAEDVPPFLGVGIIGKSKVNNELVFKAKFYYKVQFAEPTDENATKEESTSFAHDTIEGQIYMLDNGDWKNQNTFDDLDDAKAWLNGILSITATNTQGSGTNTQGSGTP